MTTKQTIFKPSVQNVLEDLKDSFKQPEYSDPQTAWSGRYKKLLSGNKFEIRDQVSFQRNLLFTGGSASFTTDEKYYYPNKTLMITSIAIAYSMGVHSIANLNLYDYQAQGIQKLRYRIFGSSTITDKFWTFNPPLICPEGFTISYSDGPLAGSEWISYHINGWYEEK